VARRRPGRRERRERWRREEEAGCREDDDQGAFEGVREEARREVDDGQEAGREEEGDSRREVSVWAVLAAAGSGERLGADRPKAFVRLGGRVLLAESLGRLDASDWIDAIVVAAPPGWEEPAILLAEELGCGKVSACVAGGASRAESVRNALAEVAHNAAVVVVHDAARPLLDDGVIERVVTALNEGWDGAVPVLPVADTIKRVDGDRVVETLARDELRAVQTPQAFIASVLREAMAGDVSSASDCASLVEARGGRVKVVAGDARLVKVTDAKDLELVAGHLGQRDRE
jgi:2-C-methyl-D-erythritol 4-phosphate cytidylyltransferase